MKKIFVIAALGLTYLCSCNKQYTCTCTVNGTVDVDTYTMYNSKRKATKLCKGYTSSVRTCVLEAY